MVKVNALSKIFKVTEEAEDERKLIKFASKNIPHFDARAGYMYYEFTKPSYVSPVANVIALKKVLI